MHVSDHSTLVFQADHILRFRGGRIGYVKDFIDTESLETIVPSNANSYPWKRGYGERVCGLLSPCTNKSQLRPYRLGMGVDAYSSGCVLAYASGEGGISQPTFKFVNSDIALTGSEMALVCILPKHVERQNLVVLVEGSSLPLVIRSTDCPARYTFIGPALTFVDPRLYEFNLLYNIGMYDVLEWRHEGDDIETFDLV